MLVVKTEVLTVGMEEETGLKHTTTITTAIITTMSAATTTATAAAIRTRCLGV